MARVKSVVLTFEALKKRGKEIRRMEGAVGQGRSRRVRPARVWTSRSVTMRAAGGRPIDSLLATRGRLRPLTPAKLSQESVDILLQSAVSLQNTGRSQVADPDNPSISP
jgi:hypothetical protein